MDKFLRDPFTFDRTVRIALFVLCVLTLTWAIAAIWEVLLPFLLAGIFAYVMMPLVRFFQDTLRLRSRSLSVLLVFFLTMGLFVLASLYLIPALQEEVVKTIEAIKQHSDGKSLTEQILPDEAAKYLESQLDFREMLQGLSLESILSTGESLWDKAGGLVSGTISVFSWTLVFAMGIIYFIFIMMDMEGLAQGLLEMFPSSARSTVKEMMKTVDYYMNSYFRGQALVAVSVGVLLAIGFSIIGLPLAIVMGIFIGLLNFIPYMQALGVIPLGLVAVLMGLQNGDNIFVSLALAYGVLMIVQIIQDSILVPRIMGTSLGMRPSLILLALAVWGYLLGFFGMLIALPITMSLYAIYMRYVLRDEDYIKFITEKMKPKQRIKQKQKEGND